MKLKQKIDYVAFLRKAQACTGKVLFKTEGGDCLNLKSTLSEYVFVAAMTAPEKIISGMVECENDNDYTMLADYLED